MIDSKLDWTAVARWEPDSGWPRIETIDAHTGGEPLRIVIGGYPSIQGDDMLGRRRFARAKLDHLRTALMWEPRGHADMYGCLITEPVTPEAAIGVLFLHNEGYSSMCGHGIIAVVKVVLETGLVRAHSPRVKLGIDTPAGLVTAFADVEDGEVTNVRFHNVPSFVVDLGAEIDVAGVGKVPYDLAYGGAFYAYVKASDAGVRCRPEQTSRLIEKGMAIKRAIMLERRIEHPFDTDLGFLYGVIFVDDAGDSNAHSRNVCIFAEGEVDRSPTGTGVSGRAAILFARNEIGTDEPIVVESIIGSRFSVRVVSETRFGPYDAVIPEVEGRAFITGRNSFVIDPRDNLSEGFILR